MRVKADDPALVFPVLHLDRSVRVLQDGDPQLVLAAGAILVEVTEAFEQRKLVRGIETDVFFLDLAALSTGDLEDPLVILDVYYESSYIFTRHFHNQVNLRHLLIEG